MPVAGHRMAETDSLSHQESEGSSLSDTETEFGHGVTATLPARLPEAGIPVA